MKFAKYQAKAKHHAEAELLLIRNYSLSSSTLSSKIIRDILKREKKQGRLFSWDYMINDNENEIKNE